MDHNVRTMDKVLANKVYVRIVAETISSVGLGNTTKIILLRLNVLPRVTIKINGKSYKTDKNNFPELLHDEIWAMRKLNSKITIAKGKMSFNYKNKRIVFNADPSSKTVTNDTIGLINEQFFSHQYDFNEIKGKDVVDIGANVGDSAIYFAVNGARRVYGFEPFPHLYEKALENIRSNKLSKIIAMNNQGVDKRESMIRISENVHGIGSGKMIGQKSGKLVKVVTLLQIVEKYKLKDALLKSDCEGFEYGIILGASDDTLRRFEELIIEYHKGYINLVERLERAGFEVWHTSPSKMLYADGSAHSYAGIIRARRVDK